MLLLNELLIVRVLFWYSPEDAGSTELQVRIFLFRPQEDPLDIPFLALENQPTEESEPPRPNIDCRIQYFIDVIPEVDSSDANSIGFQSPRIKKDFFQCHLQNKGGEERGDSVDLVSAKRPRARPRSYSENSPLMPRIKILDFLKNKEKKEPAGELGRKQVKLD